MRKMPPRLKREEVKILTLEEFMFSILASLIAAAIADLVRKWLGKRQPGL